MMRIYPTHRQLTALSDWTVKGPTSLRPNLPGLAASRERTKNMRHLARLIHALGLEPEFAEMHRASRRRDITQMPDSLCSQLYNVARYHGYITRDALSVVPLSGVQLHAVRMLAWGWTQQQAAHELGIADSSLRETVARAREAHGCGTTVQLIACVYRNEWLPNHSESSELLAQQSPRLMPKGYVTAS